MNDWRLKLGKVSPSVYIHGSEFEKLLPPGGQMYVVTTGVEDYSDESLSQAYVQAATAIRRLDDRDVDCIIAGGTPVYTTNRPNGDDGVLSELRSDVSAPLTTSLEAQVDALRSLDVTSVLAFTPYPERRNVERRDYLEREGFDVVDIIGFGEHEVVDAVDVDPGAVYRAIRRASRTLDGEFDGIYIPCAALGIVDYIDPLERDCGRPVVTSAQAQVWKAFELSGIHPNTRGYGRLFEQS